MNDLPRLKVLLCDSAEEQYLDVGKRKIFFLSPTGVRMRALPAEIQDLFSESHFVCADDKGAHFGFIVLRGGVSVRAAVDILAKHNVKVLPPHHSREPVVQDTIEALQECAPDFGVLHGFTARQVVNAANQARGFPPFALTR